MTPALSRVGSNRHELTGRGTGQRQGTGPHKMHGHRRRDVDWKSWRRGPEVRNVPPTSLALAEFRLRYGAWVGGRWGGGFCDRKVLMGLDWLRSEAGASGLCALYRGFGATLPVAGGQWLMGGVQERNVVTSSAVDRVFDPLCLYIIVYIIIVLLPL